MSLIKYVEKYVENEISNSNFYIQWVKYLTVGSPVLMFRSNFWIGQSLFSISQSLTHPVNLSVWMLFGTISFFSFWKLDYFSNINCLKNPLSDMILCSPLIQLITIDSFLILESDIDPEYIHWALTPEKFQLHFSQYVSHNLRKLLY